MYSAVGFSEWFAQKMATLKRGLGGSKRVQRPPFGSGRPTHSVPVHFSRPVRRMALTEVAEDQLGNRAGVGFEGEMARIQQIDLHPRIIPRKRLSTRINKRWIILPPDGQ